MLCTIPQRQNKKPLLFWFTTHCHIPTLSYIFPNVHTYTLDRNNVKSTHHFCHGLPHGSRNIFCWKAPSFKTLAKKPGIRLPPCYKNIADFGASAPTKIHRFNVIKLLLLRTNENKIESIDEICHSRISFLHTM